VSEGAASDKLLLVYGLARNRRSPKGPSEPRLWGVHPEVDVVGKDGAAFRLRLNVGSGFVQVADGVKYPEEAHKRHTREFSTFVGTFASKSTGVGGLHHRYERRAV
jgi:hypothetical protein